MDSWGVSMLKGRGTGICGYAHAMAHGWRAEDYLWVVLLIVLCGFGELYSGPQAWQWTLSSIEPPCWSYFLTGYIYSGHWLFFLFEFYRYFISKSSSEEELTISLPSVGCLCSSVVSLVAGISLVYFEFGVCAFFGALFRKSHTNVLKHRHHVYLSSFMVSALTFIWVFDPFWIDFCSWEIGVPFPSSV